MRQTSIKSDSQTVLKHLYVESSPRGVWADSVDFPPFIFLGDSYAGGAGGLIVWVGDNRIEFRLL